MVYLLTQQKILFFINKAFVCNTRIGTNRIDVTHLLTFSKIYTPKNKVLLNEQSTPFEQLSILDRSKSHFQLTTTNNIKNTKAMNTSLTSNNHFTHMIMAKQIFTELSKKGHFSSPAHTQPNVRARVALSRLDSSVHFRNRNMHYNFETTP